MLYATGIRGMYALMWCASLFNKKAAKWIKGRRTPLQSYEVPGDRPVAWFHCASLGEFDQGLPVMKAYKERFPEAFIVVTFFSPSGMEFYHKRDHCVDVACYMPLDTKANARAFMQHFRPVHVFFVKYEFWHNHLLAARKAGAKVYGVSSLFRPTHRFFKWYGGFFRKSLRLFDRFFAQDERSATLLQQIGITNVTVTGDTRYDRMVAVRDRNEANPVLESFINGEPTLIVGSSWPVDEELLQTSLLELLPEMKIIIAPHDISQPHVEAISARFAGKAIRYTEYAPSGNRMLILDTIGQLTSAYRYASVAYVGGGFTGKLHNILEPGAFGIPVVFGPKYDRFPEAQLFLEREVAAVVTNSGQLKAIVDELCGRRTLIAAELNRLFAQNAGAAAKVVRELPDIQS